MRRLYAGLMVVVAAVIAVVGIVGQTAPGFPSGLRQLVELPRGIAGQLVEGVRQGAQGPNGLRHGLGDLLIRHTASNGMALPEFILASIPEHADWTLRGAVLGPAPGSWEDLIWEAGPSTVLKVDGTYYMYYGGADGYDDVEHIPTNRSVGVATSTDGMSFTKHPGNPIVTHSVRPDWLEEGAGNAVVIHDGVAWHMWYGAKRGINPSEIDIDVHYRTSADGLSWTGDTLVYRYPGSEELIPVAAFKAGSTYHLYVLGPLSRGMGALSLMSGTDPTMLSAPMPVSGGPYRASGGVSELRDGSLVMHLMDNDFGTVLVHSVDPSRPGVLGPQVRSYRFSGYASYWVLVDEDGWRMYQLAISGPDDGNYILRTAPAR